MIPASLLEHAPPVAAEITRLDDVFPGWIEHYGEQPCAVEMGHPRLHRDGVCCHCLALALEVADPAADDGDPA